MTSYLEIYIVDSIISLIGNRRIARFSFQHLTKAPGSFIQWIKPEPRDAIPEADSQSNLDIHEAATPRFIHQDEFKEEEKVNLPNTKLSSHLNPFVYSGGKECQRNWYQF